MDCDLQRVTVAKLRKNVRKMHNLQQIFSLKLKRVAVVVCQ